MDKAEEKKQKKLQKEKEKELKKQAKKAKKELKAQQKLLQKEEKKRAKALKGRKSAPAVLQTAQPTQYPVFERNDSDSESELDVTDSSFDSSTAGSQLGSPRKSLPSSPLKTSSAAAPRIEVEGAHDEEQLDYLVAVSSVSFVNSCEDIDLLVPHASQDPSADEHSESEDSEDEEAQQKIENEKRLAAVRAAAAESLNAFAEQTGKVEAKPASQRRGLPPGAMFGGSADVQPVQKRGLPQGLVFGGPDDDNEEQEQEQVNGEEEEAPEKEKPEKEMTFEEIMNAAMDIEASELGGGQAVNDEEPEKKEEEEAPPEDWEVFRAVSDNDAEEIAVLAELHANLNCINSEGRTPLMKAADEEKAEAMVALLKAGADINKQSEDDVKWSALHIAALSGYPDIVKILMEHNADTTVTDSRNETPLQWAQANHEDDCIALLIGK